MSGQVLLSLQNVAVTFGKQPLFEDITFHIREGERIAVVGRNGAGKSTLMKLVADALKVDAGERWQLAGISIGMMRQDVKATPNQKIRDFVFEGIKAEDADSVSYLVDMVLQPLELDPDSLTITLSGGQMRRAELARALVEDPDILLLDEPTNHLDLDIIEWLENYLKGQQKTFVCISHDKTFLANVTNKVFWIDRGDIKVSPEGFAKFEDWSTQLLEQEERELHNRQKKLDIEQEWASRGVKARRKRNQQRLENMKKERARLKAEQSTFRRVTSKIKIDAPDVELTSKNIAEFYNVSKSFDDKILLEQFSMKIQRGDRIGILGKNGSGKTTFLKLLIGELEPGKGSVKRRKEVEFSYFDQRRSKLNDDYSLWKTLSEDENDYIDVMGKERHVCGYLKQFLFDPAEAKSKVSTLSGGQKNRLMLAKVLANPKNFLILDEPTNDLDMDTLDMLEDILCAYNGTLIVVSHDRDFLDQTVSQVLAFEGDGKVESVIGGYSDYLEFKKKQDRTKSETSGVKAKTKKENPSSQKEVIQKKSPAPKLTYKDKYELEQLPKKIAAHEEEIAALTERLKDPNFYQTDPEEFLRAGRHLERAKKKLDEAETRWLELSENV
tara:strand:- start:33222 stop:35054 length:1833 start_codon:yes stop_codon:yes gene_type:complete